MASGKDGFTALRFSTSDLPEGERLSFWSDFFANQFVHCDVEVADDEPFHAEAEVLIWPGLQALWSKETAMRYSRSAKQAADGNDSLVLLIRQTGLSVISQRGHDVTLGIGDSVAFLGAEPASASVSNIECLALVAPRAALIPMVGDVESKTMRRIAGDCEALRLLKGYAGLLRGGPSLAIPEVQQLAVTHIYDLIAVVLGATQEGTQVAAGRGIRAARLRAIKADVLQHIGSSDLTIAAVARRQSLSPRYVHMLLEAEGLTFSQFVLDQRLTRAYRMLKEPRLRLMTISTIAFSVGFGDLSYFNRSFRRRFGATPSELRHGFCRGSHSGV
jgi:AraC-like DNA-binding protein